LCGGNDKLIDNLIFNDFSKEIGKHMINDLKPWKKIGSESGPNLKLFQVRWDSLENPRTNQILKRLVLETEDWVNIVPITTGNHVVLVDQYRFGISKITSEIPGGLIDNGEDSKSAAIRELEEETGYTGGEWKYLGSVEPNPAFHTNRCHHWLALGVKQTREPSLDPGEDIKVETVSFPDLRKLISTGQIGHVLALSALSRVPQIWQSFEAQDFFNHKSG
jgi:8-oxo-dGTP pyrophosphatase MutT (NUDIX family)